MAPSVYVETSILSAFADPRENVVSQAQRVKTTEWWRRDRFAFDLFCSQAVVDELMRGDFPGREEALGSLDAMTRLPITEMVEGVAQVYVDQLVMPRGTRGDALHLAAASVHEADYLLTWNCGHLANVHKVSHIRVINMRLGLLTPQIVTPDLLPAEEDGQ